MTKTQRPNDSCDQALTARANHELQGSSNHASAWRSLCSFSTRRLRNCNCSKPRRAGPGCQEARAPCADGPACATANGTSVATSCDGSTICRGPPRTASGHGAACRTGVPAGFAATASSHGAASDAANRCTAARRHAENRRTVASEHATLPVHASFATGAGRPARTAHSTARSAIGADPAGVAARRAFAPERAAPGAHRPVAAARAAVAVATSAKPAGTTHTAAPARDTTAPAPR